MPEYLRVTAGAKRLTFVRRDDDATAPIIATADVGIDPDKRTVAQTKRAARCLEVVHEYLLNCIDKGPGDYAIDLAGFGQPCAFAVRGLLSPECTTHTTFLQALDCKLSSDHVIEWEDRSQCCAVDLDFHGGNAPAGLLALAAGLSPMPYRYWLTKSGGLRLIYLRSVTQPAHALAGIAGLALLTVHRTAGLELITRTRFPEGDVWGSCELQDDTCNAVRMLQGKYTVDDREFADWLESKGLVVGDAFAHVHCPANPHPRAEGNAAPVKIFDDHIYCHVCNADGVCFGSHTAGYFPAARLCGSFSQSLFALCTEHMTHWQHAKFAIMSMDALSGRETIAKAVYWAALALRHGACNPLIPGVFTSGDNLIRYDGHWGDDQGKPVLFREGQAQRLHDLPAAQFIDGEGKVGVSLKMVEWLRHTGDISRYGYPHVAPIWGVHLSHQLPPADWRICTVLHPANMRGNAMRDRLPRYLTVGSRLTLDEAWARIEVVFPRVNRNAVMLLVAAKGCCETGMGLPPLLLFSGPTGAGKSATVKLASAILGDHATEIPYTPNTERLRAGLMHAKKKGSFAVFDEFLKGASKSRKDPAESMECLLNFTPDSESHMLYVGPVALGALPVCVWSDTTVPEEIITHAQLARRLAWVKLDSRMSWETSLQAAGIPGPDAVRTHGGEGLRAACDTILSHVADTHFQLTPVFRDIVGYYNFSMLEATSLMQERELVIRQFYEAVCGAPVLQGADAKRYPAPGWKLLDLSHDSSDIVALWDQLADEGKKSSRTLAETDIAAACGLDTPTTFDIRSHGYKRFVRFTRKKVNAELELCPDRSGIHGRGDAECVQPESGGWEGVFARSIDTLALCGLPESK